MFTLTTLRHFSKQSWDWHASRLQETANQLSNRAQELHQIAQKTRQDWPDTNGQQIANQIDAQARQDEGKVPKLNNSAQVITHASEEIDKNRLVCKAAEISLVAKAPECNTDDDGTVTEPWLLMFTDPMRWGYVHQIAVYTTFVYKNHLSEASAEDHAAAIGLRAMMGKDYLDDSDGPLDMSDEGIRLQVSINCQDANGFCAYLSPLASIANADPAFIRGHVKWNAGTGRYEVRLYDPMTGQPVVVEVDPTEANGPDSQEYSTKNSNTFMSIYEKAVRKQFPEIGSMNFDESTRLITGRGCPERPATDTSFDEIRDTLGSNPPGAVMAATPGAAEQQPDDVDPHKRLVQGHAYSVKGFDAQGNIILMNPWGPAGGMSDGKFYPGEVHLTEEEYRRWVGGIGQFKAPF